MGKIVCVTGGCGFIAHHLIKELGQDERNELIVALDHDTSKLKKGFWDDSFCPIKVVDADITELPSLVPHIEQADVCYHLASATSVPESMKEPYKHFFNNVFGSMNVIQECMESKTRLIFTSSASIYGRGAVPPIQEYTPHNPLSPYALSKSTVENYINLYWKLEGFNLNACVLRLSNVYGVFNEKNVISKFLYAFLDNSPITVYGDGEQTRDFVEVGDVVRALTRAGESKVKGTYNIGSGKETAVNKLISVLREKITNTSSIKYERAIKGDIKHSVLDISLAKRELEWKPEIGLEQGVSKWLAHLNGKGKGVKK
jgi:UDP-glucose 4-epimerase